MTLSTQAQALYDALPEDGAMLSGGKLRLAVVMSNTEFDAAKQELRDSGTVAIGRGRGGTLGRKEGDTYDADGTSEIRPSVEQHVAPRPAHEAGEEETREGADSESKKPTLQERAAMAREAKLEKSTSQKRIDGLREMVLTAVQKRFNVPDETKVLFYTWDRGLEPYLEIPRVGGANVIRVRTLMGSIPEDWLLRL